MPANGMTVAAKFILREPSQEVSKEDMLGQPPPAPGFGFASGASPPHGFDFSYVSGSGWGYGSGDGSGYGTGHGSSYGSGYGSGYGSDSG